MMRVVGRVEASGASGATPMAAAVTNRPAAPVPTTMRRFSGDEVMVRVAGWEVMRERVCRTAAAMRLSIAPAMPEN